MTPKQPKQARAILRASIDKDGGQYVSWALGDKHITLEGKFTIKELEAIIAYVKGAK